MWELEMFLKILTKRIDATKWQLLIVGLEELQVCKQYAIPSGYFNLDRK